MDDSGLRYDGVDFYCDVAIPYPERLRVVHECEHVLAFRHTRPGWRTHIVAVPKPHIRSLTTVTREDEVVIRRLLHVVQSVARDVEHTDGAARIITNVGRYQDSKHLHVHVVSGERLG